MEVQMYSVYETATAVQYESFYESESEYVTRYYRRHPSPLPTPSSMGNWSDCTPPLLK
jgi:hypothetical protein